MSMIDMERATLSTTWAWFSATTGSTRQRTSTTCGHSTFDENSETSARRHVRWRTSAYYSASTGNQSAALQALQESLRLRTVIGDTRGKGEVYFNIASIYRHVDNPGAALEYYTKDLAICQ